tara:strand:+ start:534 stop:722 length:189 start_codon:yes stop_codon:yes gene_type:complete
MFETGYINNHHAVAFSLWFDQAIGTDRDSDIETFTQNVMCYELEGNEYDQCESALKRILASD